LAVRNFNSQVDAATRQVQANPRNLPARQHLVGLLLSRTQYLGTWDDFDTAFALVDEAIALGLNPAKTAKMHATVLSAVHRFDEALVELDRAESLGAKHLAAARETISLARGESPNSVIAERRSVASATPSYKSETKLAAALTMGHLFDESDKAYQAALSEYRDVSPFPIAWVAFQRGKMWSEMAGDTERAMGLYQDAVATLPQYVVGNVHLAELEAKKGDVRGAIQRLERIVDTTVDPEPASRLAQFLADRDPERSRNYAARADVGYQKLIAKYPLAFADHAAEFYLGSGHDADKAWKLAMLNLENRKTPRAYHLAAVSALAANAPAKACEIANEGHISLPEGGCS